MWVYFFSLLGKQCGQTTGGGGFTDAAFTTDENPTQLLVVHQVVESGFESVLHLFQ